jgi:hypothetical protein
MMLQRLALRAAPLTSRAADVVPVAPACCNVCRTCVTTNLVGVATGGVVAVLVVARRLAGRVVKPS